MVQEDDSKLGPSHIWSKPSNHAGSEYLGSERDPDLEINLFIVVIARADDSRQPGGQPDMTSWDRASLPTAHGGHDRDHWPRLVVAQLLLLP